MIDRGITGRTERWTHANANDVDLVVNGWTVFIKIGFDE